MNQANWNDILGKAKEFGKAVGDVAGEVVDASRQKLDEIARYLYEKETITGSEFMEILDRPEN